METPIDLDPQCVELFHALNGLPGIWTTGCCCGHGTQPYRFWFKTRNIYARGFVGLLRAIDPRYGAPVGWAIWIQSTDLVEDPHTFVLQGPMSDQPNPEIIQRILAPSAGDIKYINQIPL